MYFQWLPKLGNHHKRASEASIAEASAVAIAGVGGFTASLKTCFSCRFKSAFLNPLFCPPLTLPKSFNYGLGSHSPAIYGVNEELADGKFT
jgi:hypothetical protein